jgi:radical SAM protein with 4Fe4S-binding SPASM domain
MQDTFASLLSLATRSRHPCFASIELTFACNLACTFCYNPVARKGQRREAPPPPPPSAPLAFEEILDLQDQLRDMGVLFLTLTGGEPMLHPRFWDVAYAAKERSFAVRIFTNGTLIDEASADRLADLRPYCLELSLHGARPETAEALHQTPGAFQAQVEALGLLRDRGLRVYLKCLVTRLLENELDEVKALGDRFGFPVYFDPILTCSDDGQEYPLELAVTDEGLRRLCLSPHLNVGNSPFQREPGQYNCNAGLGTLNVDPYGNVLPCVQWKQPIGNLREEPLREIWEHSELLREVRRVNRASAESLQQEVEDHAYCMHCPGLSLLRSGDPLRPEPQFVRLARIRRTMAQGEAPQVHGPPTGNRNPG